MSSSTPTTETVSSIQGLKSEAVVAIVAGTISLGASAVFFTLAEPLTALGFLIAGGRLAGLPEVSGHFSCCAFSAGCPRRSISVCIADYRKADQ